MGDLFFSRATIKRRKEPTRPLFEFSIAVVNPDGQWPEGNTCQNQIDVIVLIDVCGYEVRWNVAVKIRLKEDSPVSLRELDLDRER